MLRYDVMVNEHILGFHNGVVNTILDVSPNGVYNKLFLEAHIIRRVAWIFIGKVTRYR